MKKRAEWPMIGATLLWFLMTFFCAVGLSLERSERQADCAAQGGTWGTVRTEGRFVPVGGSRVLQSWTVDGCVLPPK